MAKQPKIIWVDPFFDRRHICYGFNKPHLIVLAKEYGFVRITTLTWKNLIAVIRRCQKANIAILHVGGADSFREPAISIRDARGIIKVIRKAGCKVIIITAGSPQIFQADVVLSKPFSAAKLAALIRELSD